MSYLFTKIELKPDRTQYIQVFNFFIQNRQKNQPMRLVFFHRSASMTNRSTPLMIYLVLAAVAFTALFTFVSAISTACLAAFDKESYAEFAFATADLTNDKAASEP